MTRSRCSWPSLCHFVSLVSAVKVKRWLRSPRRTGIGTTSLSPTQQFGRAVTSATDRFVSAAPTARVYSHFEAAYLAEDEAGSWSISTTREKSPAFLASRVTSQQSVGPRPENVAGLAETNRQASGRAAFRLRAIAS